MKTAQQVFFLVLLTITCFLFTTPKAIAQAPQSYVKPNVNSDVPMNLHTWSQTVMIEVLAAANCQLIGVDPTNPTQECLGVDPQTGKIGFIKNSGGLVGLMSYAIGATYTKPMGTGDYVNYLASNFGITKPAYAAGPRTGFQSIVPLANLWVAFRNIVYMLFIIIFIIVGVAIMLRVKIDPRTVMSIENQIPKIIIGLLLVTFSFAIAGLLIDFMWVSIYLIINVLSSLSSDPLLNANIYHIAHATNPFTAANAVGGTYSSAGGIGSIIGQPADSVAGIVSDAVDKTPMLKGFFTLVGGILAGVAIKASPASQIMDALKTIPFFGVIAGGIAAGVAFAFTKEIVSFLTGAIATIVIGIAVLWALFRIWFALTTAYVSILLQVIFAPFWIIGGVVPGSPLGFTSWLRSILANLMAFPATIGLFILGKILMEQFNSSGAALFVPPLVGDPNASSAGKGLGPLIGLGIILLAPQVVSMVKEAFKAPQLKQAAGAGQALGVGFGAINVLEHTKQIGMYQYYTGYLRGFPVLGKLLGQGSAAPQHK